METKVALLRRDYRYRADLDIINPSQTNDRRDDSFFPYVKKVPKRNPEHRIDIDFITKKPSL